MYMVVKVQNIFLTAEDFLVPLPAPSWPYASADVLFLTLHAIHINKILQYLLFCVWLLLLRIMFWRLFHLVVCISSTFFFCCYVFIHVPIDRLGFFPVFVSCKESWCEHSTQVCV